MNDEILKAVLTHKQVFTLALASLLDNTSATSHVITHARLLVNFCSGEKAVYPLSINQSKLGSLQIMHVDAQGTFVAEFSHHHIASVTNSYTYIPEGDYVLQLLDSEGKTYRSVTHLQRNTPSVNIYTSNF